MGAGRPVLSPSMRIACEVRARIDRHRRLYQGVGAGVTLAMAMVALAWQPAPAPPGSPAARRAALAALALLSLGVRLHHRRPPPFSQALVALKDSACEPLAARLALDAAALLALGALVWVAWAQTAGR